MLLLQTVQASSYKIIIFTETWLNDEFYDSELHMGDYNIYRKDRSADTSPFLRGGGVLIAVHKSLVSSCLACTQDIEQVFVSVGNGKNRIILGCVYFPPRSPRDAYISLGENLDKISDLYNTEIHLFGDFNLPNAVWDSDNLSSTAISPPNTPLIEVESTELLSNICSFLNLFQVNNIRNDRDVILDLVLSHDASTTVHQADEVLIPPDAYHPPLCVSLTHSTHSNNDDLFADDFYRDFKSTDFNLINDYLSMFSWDELFSSVSLEEMVSTFNEILYRAIDIFVPLKRISSKKFPRWYNTELKNCIFAKKKAHKMYKITRSHEDYINFANLRATCKRLTVICYNDYVHSTEHSIHNNLKSFWNFVNSQRKAGSIPNELSYNNSTSSSGPEKANLFAEFFSSVYSKKSNVIPDNLLSTNIFNISNCTISISEIYSKLNSLDIYKGPGPDGIPPILLKQCSFILSRPLCIIFNLSLKTGIFPQLWKASYITPIHKSGDIGNITNYRPICVISAIPKLFESLVTDFLTPQIDSTIIDQQFGFRSGRSTELNLLSYTDFILLALEKGSQVHAIYTDFAKAFDKVNHPTLLSKLKLIGINGSLLDWLESYLTDRTQIVRVNNFRSNEIQVSSGVPQGSHLGPLLFNLFINDIRDCFINGSVLLFADDLKLFAEVNGTQDCIKLQEDLERLTTWCNSNGMELNANKCHTMSFSRIKDPLHHVYYINNTPLDNVSTIKDLGVLLDQSLSFSPHISQTITKSLKMLGFIKRTSQDFTNTSSIKLLYCSLVRPHLEYASCVWSPFYNIHIRNIENVQHKFLRYIAHKSNVNFEYANNFDYAFLESELHINSLEVRRIHRDLKLLYNIINSNVSCPYLLEKIGIHAPPRTTRSVNTFHVPTHRTNYGFNSYVTRSTRMANTCTNLDFFTSPTTFVEQLTNYSLNSTD